MRTRLSNLSDMIKFSRPATVAAEEWSLAVPTICDQTCRNQEVADEKEAPAVSCLRAACFLPAVASGSAGQLNSFPALHLSDALVKREPAACHCVSMSLVTHVVTVLSDYFMPVPPAAWEALFPARLAAPLLFQLTVFQAPEKDKTGHSDLYQL